MYCVVADEAKGQEGSGIIFQLYIICNSLGQAQSACARTRPSYSDLNYALEYSIFITLLIKNHFFLPDDRKIF